MDGENPATPAALVQTFSRGGNTMGYGMKTLRWTCTTAFLTVLFALPLIVHNSSAFAQGIITGSIGGSITDETGAVIPNATIVAVNSSTELTLQAKSGGEGTFFISNVPIGTYTLAIEASGFGKASLRNVQVEAGNTTSIGRQALAPSGTAETVQVEAGAAELINTESAQVETTISTEQLSSAPVTGAIDNLALVSPGVVNAHNDANSNTNGINFSVNGQRGRSNNSEIDGQTNNDTSIGGPSFFFDNQDAVQEVQVLTTDMGAQYGRNMGAIVNYITKGGTNSFHGTGFEIYTGSWLSSLTQGQKAPQFGWCSGGVTANCAPTVVPKFVQNNWGGTLGGPILKNKLFFFGSTLWDHTYEGGQTLTSQGGLFPDSNGMATLKNTFGSNPAIAAIAANGPYSTPIGNPRAVGATQTIAVTDGTHVANVELSQFERTFPDTIFDQEHLGRIDYDMS
ncbi:MAG: carboxypeptidase regulatory-like domain-containing protein [Terracidiphilus sp.]